MFMIKKTVKKLLYSFLPKSTVLLFHHVNQYSDIIKSGCILDYSKFCSIIDKFNNYESLGYIIEHPSSGKVAITFDDGLEDVYTHAYPYLMRKKIPFTIFVVTDFIGQPGYITELQLKEMADSGIVTIGSHGVSHKIFSQLDYEQKKRELEDSKRILQDIIKKPVCIFAYSHGIVDTDIMVKFNYYKYAMAVREEPLNILTKIIRSNYSLPRYNIDNNTFYNVLRELECFKFEDIRELK